MKLFNFYEKVSWNVCNFHSFKEIYSNFQLNFMVLNKKSFNTVGSSSSANHPDFFLIISPDLFMSPYSQILLPLWQSQ